MLLQNRSRPLTNKQLSNATVANYVNMPSNTTTQVICRPQHHNSTQHDTPTCIQTPSRSSSWIAE
jgi:hypothetical protein